MVQYKLGVGPMSKEINRLIDEYSVHTPLMVIASRNQVDYNSGYVCVTADLPAQFSNRKGLLLCRDHCGPYFKNSDKGLSVDEAMQECFKTIDADIAAGFNLIHVDVSKIPDNQLYYAKILIDYILSKSPDMLLEFGSEDNTGEGLEVSKARIDEQLEFIKQYLPNIIYFVSQTGSYTLHQQVGRFDIHENLELANKIHAAGVLFKEHNADYITTYDVAMRRKATVDALNIAPQLGAAQTKVSLWCSNKYNAPSFYTTPEWNTFADMVYSKQLWKRWVPEGMDDKEIAVRVSGHYFFNTPEYQAVLASIDYELFEIALRSCINSIFDIYTKEHHGSN